MLGGPPPPQNPCGRFLNSHTSQLAELSGIYLYKQGPESSRRKKATVLHFFVQVALVQSLEFLIIAPSFPRLAKTQDHFPRQFSREFEPPGERFFIILMTFSAPGAPFGLSGHAWESRAQKNTPFLVLLYLWGDFGCPLGCLGSPVGLILEVRSRVFSKCVSVSVFHAILESLKP